MRRTNIYYFIHSFLLFLSLLFKRSKFNLISELCQFHMIIFIPGRLESKQGRKRPQIRSKSGKERERRGERDRLLQISVKKVTNLTFHEKNNQSSIKQKGDTKRRHKKVTQHINDLQRYCVSKKNTSQIGFFYNRAFLFTGPFDVTKPQSL